MRILLLGEFSGLHWSLAEGLRALGHDVCVASDGCGWRNYPRDIALDRPTDSLRDGIFVFSASCVIYRVFGDMMLYRLSVLIFCAYAANALCRFIVICSDIMVRSSWELSGPIIIISALVWKQMFSTIRILRSEAGIVIQLLIRLLFKLVLWWGSSCHSDYS